MKCLALATFLDEPFITPEQSSHGKPLVAGHGLTAYMTHWHTLHQCPLKMLILPSGRMNLNEVCSEHIVRMSSAFHFFIASFSGNNSPSVSSSLYGQTAEIRPTGSQNNSHVLTFKMTSSPSSSVAGTSTCSLSVTAAALQECLDNFFHMSPSSSSASLLDSSLDSNLHHFFPLDLELEVGWTSS